MHNFMRQLSAKVFTDLLFGPMLQIYVGSEKKCWSLHQNLLRHHSKFFDDSDYVNGEHRRIKDGQVDLSDEDIGAFEILVKWLYQGTIEDVSSMPADTKWDYAFTCQKLYMLCDRLEIEELKNLAIDQFRKGCNEARLVPGAEEIVPIYERTKSGCPIRKLISKIVARQIMDPDTLRSAAIYQACFVASPEFAMDVINAIREESGGFLLDDPTEGNTCRYHLHANGKTCQKTVTFEEGT